MGYKVWLGCECMGLHVARVHRSLGAQLVRLLVQPAGLALRGLGDIGGLLLRRRLQGGGLLLGGGDDLVARCGRVGHDLVCAAACREAAFFSAAAMILSLAAVASATILS